MHIESKSTSETHTNTSLNARTQEHIYNAEPQTHAHTLFYQEFSSAGPALIFFFFLGPFYLLVSIFYELYIHVLKFMKVSARIPLAETTNSIPNMQSHKVHREKQQKKIVLFQKLNIQLHKTKKQKRCCPPGGVHRSLWWR